MRERLPAVLLALSVVALLATSAPKGWKLSATITTPTTPAAPRGLEVAIDASSQPRLFTTGVPKGGWATDTPCFATWTAGSTLTCLLPPGATLTDVSITGGCGGCSGSCPPPPGVFARATTKEVDVWRDDVTSKTRAKLPSHASGVSGTTYSVIVTGARFTEVTLEVRPAGTGTSAYREQQSCERCTFYVDDSFVVAGPDFDVIVAATGFDECGAASASGGCVPPRTLAIVSAGPSP